MAEAIPDAPPRTQAQQALDAHLLQSKNNRRGIILALCAMALFVCNDSLVKLATSSFSTGQVLVIRGLFATSIMLTVVLVSKQGKSLRLMFTRLLMVRATAESMVALCFVTSISQLALADLTAILQATPLIITLFSVVLGIEKIGWRRWSAVIVGFVGVLLVVKPGGHTFNIYALLALLSCFLVAFRDLMTRKINPAIPTVVVSLTTTLSVVVVGLLLGLESWKPIELQPTLYLLAAAMFVSAGNMSIVKAYRIADPSAVSPFRYSVVIWAFLSGFVVFGEIPDALAIIGTGLIVASGIYTVHRERVRARELTTEANLSV